MILASRVLFLVLMFISTGTLFSLGNPRTYRDREVSWYLALSAWIALLTDTTFLSITYSHVGERWLTWLLLGFIALRVPSQCWLWWMIERGKRR